MRSKLGLYKVFALYNLKIFMAVIMLISLAAGLRLWLLDANNTDLIWLTFYPVVIASALYAGLYAGLLATASACLTVAWLWPLWLKRPLLENNVQLIEMATFIAVCGFICYLVGALNRSRTALQQAKDQQKVSAKREQFISEIINYMPNMIGYWDTNLRCRFANNAFSQWYYKQPEEIIGMSFQELAGEALFALNEPHIRAVLAGKPQRFERTLRKTDGTLGNILGQYIPDFDADGKVQGFAIQSSEVTDLKETEAQLKMAACVFDNTVDGVAIIDIDGLILSVNPAFEKITGYNATEVIGLPSESFKTNQHPQEFYLKHQQQMASKGYLQGELWSRRKDGGLFLARLSVSSVRDDNGEPTRYVSVFSDITELWRKDEYLKHLAFYDSLTNLPNRTLMMERLEQKIIEYKREPCQLALMFIDLNGFKFVNDNFGHNAGDELLKVVAQKLSALVRESDTVARMGGDEFIFILNNPKTKQEVIDVAERMLTSINEPIDVSGTAIEIAMSIGIAMYPSDGTSADQLIKNADSAMYSAKKSAKNTVRFFSEL